jgi:phage-related protein
MVQGDLPVPHQRFIHVVHAFEKDSREIPENEKEVARQNLSAVTAYLREEKKRAKRKK